MAGNEGPAEDDGRTSPQSPDPSSPEYWSSLITEGNLTPSEIINEHFELFGDNSGPLTSGKCSGAKDWMTAVMRGLRMKCTHAQTNLKRYSFLCHHFVRTQQHKALPKTYHSFHVKIFWKDMRFWRFFFGWFFAVFAYPSVQFAMSMVILWYMHSLSHHLYMVPIPQLLAPYSCVKMPFQWHCGILTFVQSNTFSGLYDMKKTALVLFMRIILDFMTSLLSRKLKFD